MDPSPPTNGQLSTAERLMLQHSQKQSEPNGVGAHHLSYEEMRATSGPVPEPPSSSSSRPDPSKQPDMDSETAFPSLGTPSAAPKTAGGWGSGPALSARLGAGSGPGTNSNSFTETLVLFLSSIHIGPVPPQFRDKGPRAAGEKREEDPKTLPDVLRAIQRRHPTVSLESSTSRDRVTILFRTPYTLAPVTTQTPALVKAAHSLSPEERIVRARQELITRVTRKIEKTVLVPVQAKAFVIGPKGRTLRNIVESTGASVNVPPKDGSDEDSEEMVPITIAGEESAVLDAEDRIRAIVKERTNKLSAKLNTIPTSFYPKLDGPDPQHSKLQDLARRKLVEEHGLSEQDVNCRVHVPALQSLRHSAASHFCLADEPEVEDEAGPDPDPSIVVTGEREQVEVVLKLIQTVYDEMLRKTTKVEFELPKRQHRFLDPLTLHEILASTGSVVSLPPPNNPSEKVIVRGEKMANVQALGMVMTAANTREVEVLDLTTLYPKLANTEGYTRNLITYLATKSAQPKLRQIQESFKGKVKIYIPVSSALSCSIELVGEDTAEIAKAKEAMTSYLTTTLRPECFQTVEVDYLLHRHLANKKNVKLRAMLDQRGVELIIPPEQERSSNILLAATKASKPEEHIGKVKDEILRLVKELANIQTREIEIEQRWHSYILGPNSTTLNAIIGEEKLVSVKVGEQNNKDLIVIRGTKDEVERVDKEIRRIGEEAKVNDTINSFTTEFEVESKHVSHLVGKGGSTVAKLREELGVKVDFGDQSNGTEAESGGAQQHRKKRNQAVKVSIVIQGRKENVEEAKKRILAMAERLADEVSVSVPVLAGVDQRSLVGKGGKYFTRLQDLHLVHINMPRSQGDNVSEGNESITIRGPKKGVEAVKKELVELMEYEKENGNTLTLNVSTKSIARIVGKGGATADRIREETGIGALDINRSEGVNEVSQVVMKGTKQAISAAKKMINAIVQEVDDECSVDVVIEKAFHQALIGKGGAKLRELVKRAGGDEENARSVRFPRSYEEGREGEIVNIKGSKKLVPKIKEELEAEVARLKAQVVYAVRISRASQPGLIGRGASGLKTLQGKFQVAIHAPGWREWSVAPEAVNNDEFKGVDPAEIFKVVGSKEACLAAAEVMKSKAEPKERPSSKVTITVNVPSALQQQVSNNGRFFRELPDAVRIEHGNFVPSRVPPSLIEKVAAGVVMPVPTSRIDVDEEASPQLEIGWNVVEIPKASMSEEREIPWNIHGPTTEEVEKVAKVIRERVQEAGTSGNAPRASHLAVARVPANSMARIIGKGGSGLKMMSEESGGGIVDVIGKTGSDSVSVVGSLEQLEVIRKILSRLVSQTR